MSKRAEGIFDTFTFPVTFQGVETLLKTVAIS